jgi:hypothetical protein
MTTSGGSTDPLALVMGDVDLVRALGIAGISSAFLGSATDPARFSHHVRVSLPWLDPWEARRRRFPGPWRSPLAGAGAGSLPALGRVAAHGLAPPRPASRRVPVGQHAQAI